MTDIYMNAYLVISAANARSSEQGFLQDRDILDVYGKIWQIPFQSMEERGYFGLCETNLQNDIEEEIDKRAWTMQEHFTALRLLRYGSKQVEWRCPQAHDGDGGDCDFANQDDPNFFTEQAETHIPYAERSHKIKGPWLDSSGQLDNWMTILKRYSLRQISVQNDRLPAFSAVAASFARTMGWDYASYFARLWEQEFVLQLLWYPTSKRVKAKRDSPITCPSWTWASFPGSFMFFQGAGYQTEARLIGRPKISLQSEETHFGNVDSGGRLTIVGYLQRCCWTGSVFLQMDDASRNTGIPSHVRIRWNQEEAGISRSLWFLEVTDGAKRPVGLVLQSVDKGTYQRVGFFQYVKDAEADLHYDDDDVSGGTYRTFILPKDLHDVQRQLEIV